MLQFCFCHSLRFLGDCVLDFDPPKAMAFTIYFQEKPRKETIAGYTKHTKLNDTEEVNDIAGKVCSLICKSIAADSMIVSTQPCSISKLALASIGDHFPDFQNS